MLTRIIEFSIKNKLIIALFTLAMILYGAFETARLPIDAVPDITNNQVQVITVSSALGAPEVERLVTFPVEQACSNIPDIKEIRSFSRFGLSLVTIVFDDGTDVYWARQQVSERIQTAVNIPKGVGTPTMAPVTTGLGEIYQYVLKPEKGYEKQFGPTELRTLQDWIVRRQLLGTPGVADVSSFGGMLKQYEIAVDANKLKATGVTMNELFTALQTNNQNTGGAYIEKGPNLLFIRSEGLLQTISDIENISVKITSGGMPVLIRDVADIRIGHAIRYGTMFYNDEREVAGAVVMMLKGANSNAVIKKVKERITQIQKTLPKGVVIEPFLDRTKMVNHAIGTVKQNLLEGALIVVFVLVLFLGNLRAGFLVASVIPLSMLFAIIMMNLFGVSGNLMSLGALDFGLIVDGAVIIVEAVLHRLIHHRKTDSEHKITAAEMNDTVKTSAGRMMNSAVFGQMIILVVYLPVFTLQGIEGKMFIPMAQTVAFALLGAFILSLTYIPMMSAWFLSKNISNKRNISEIIMGKLEMVYQKILNKLLNKHVMVIGISLLLFAGSLVILSRLGGEFIPKLEEGDFAVETRIITGSNLNMSMETSQKAAAILRKKFPEVIKVVGKIGSGEIPTDPMPIEGQDLMIILKDKKDWTSAKTFDEMAEKMATALSDIPGVSFGFQYPVQMRFNELMTGARQDVVCKIFGENLDSLASIAAKLGDIASTVKGAQDIFVEPVSGLPQIVIHYNRPAIARYGINIDDMNNIVNTAFAGQAAGQIFEGEKRFDLVVRLNDKNRQSVEDVRNLLIPTPNGDQVPLSQFADVNIVLGPNQIQREDAKRRIIVGFNARGRDVQSIVEEMQVKTNKKIALPPGYFITYGGSFENLQAAKKRLSIAVPISLLLIFLLLYFAFHSVKNGLLIYSAIPLSAIGGILALAIRGMPFSISAGVGFIALFGVAVLNGIVLIAEFKKLQSEGWTDMRKIVLHGTKTRLRPVFMTASVASLGFLPMALSHGAGAEVQRPLATVVIGGLISATFLTLFLLPMLYVIFHRPKKINVKNAAVLLVLFAATALKGQTPIGIEGALDSALKNNLVLHGEYLNVKYYQALQKTAKDIAQTSLETEYGQFNSAYVDTRFSLSQAFAFPALYNRQKSVLYDLTHLSEMQASFAANALKREVQTLFYKIVFLQQKETVLKNADSLYTSMLQKAQTRLNTGESNTTERDIYLTQKLQSETQLQQVIADREITILQFQLLLNTKTKYIPDPVQTSEPALPLFTDTGFMAAHPAVKMALDELKISMDKARLEKARLLPELRLGYNNMSIRGVGNDEKKYTAVNRFQSVNLSVGIPLFSSATRARINAYEKESEKNRVALDATRQSLMLKWEAAWKEYESALFNLNLYRNGGLQSAENILRSAQEQLRTGEIDYLEFATLSNKALSTQADYADSEFRYHQALIQIHTLSNP